MYAYALFRFHCSDGEPSETVVIVIVIVIVFVTLVPYIGMS